MPKPVSSLRGHCIPGARAAQVSVEMECSASELRWLWALHGVLEGILIKQAHSTARAFCEFVRRRCAEHAARGDSLGQARSSMP